VNKFGTEEEGSCHGWKNSLRKWTKLELKCKELETAGKEV